MMALWKRIGNTYLMKKKYISKIQILWFWDPISIFGRNGTKTPKFLKIVQNDIFLFNFDWTSSIVTKLGTDKQNHYKNKLVMAFWNFSQN